MKILVQVQSGAYDTPYGGEQMVEAIRGEFLMDEIFRLPFFRMIIDDIIGDAVCFRLMEGGEAHYFVLEGSGDTATFERETSIGYDSFKFTLVTE
jgi:hypothetical protein